jgi:hypothetical protein
MWKRLLNWWYGRTAQQRRLITVPMMKIMYNPFHEKWMWTRFNPQSRTWEWFMDALDDEVENYVHDAIEYSKVDVDNELLHRLEIDNVFYSSMVFTEDEGMKIISQRKELE